MKNIKLLLGLGFVLLLLGIQSCKKDECTLSCQNNGIVTIDCDCACPTGFEGPQCETATCSTVCQNNGDLTQQCTCDCPSGFIGDFCETCIPKVGLFERSLYYAPGNTNYVDNVESTLPAGYVLTGLGFSFETIMIAGREVQQDGTLGDEVQFRDGPNPNGNLDYAYTPPANHVITGVGFGKEFSSDTRRLVVNYNEVNFDADCDLELGPPLLYDNGGTSDVEAWLKITDTNLDDKTHAFRGLGIRFSSTSSAPKQVEATIAEFVNQF